MSQENVETVRTRYEQFARGDFSEMTDVADDFELVTSPENPEAGTYRGEAGKQWLKTWVESFDGLTIEATEIVDAGDEVFLAIVQRGRPHGSRTVVEERWWQALTVRGGVVSRVQTFRERADALEAAGLAE